jgi:hypothetical protein
VLVPVAVETLFGVRKNLVLGGDRRTRCGRFATVRMRGRDEALKRKQQRQREIQQATHARTLANRPGHRKPHR